MNETFAADDTRHSSRDVNIGAAAAQSGLAAKTIRAYERAGLIPPRPRTAGGYRTFSESDIHVLRFIQRAREFGFSLSTIRQLLALWKDVDRSSVHVKALAMAHIGAIDAKIADLVSLRAAVQDLAEHAGEDRPSCPRFQPALAGRPEASHRG